MKIWERRWESESSSADEGGGRSRWERGKYGSHTGGGVLTVAAQGDARVST